MIQRSTIGVVIPSAGRGALLAQVLRSLQGQDGVTFQTVVSVPDDASLPPDRSLLDGVTVVTSPRGLSAQRNAGVAALAEGTEVVAFFDDDSVVRSDWLGVAVDFLQQHPGVVGLTGRVLLDGAVTGEVSEERTESALRASWAEPYRGTWRATRELYGCNFAVRLDAADRPEMFDERLPLYSWLEDHDLARRMARRGTLAEVDDCVIVHRAAASGGRQNHRRLGYSQVMNPVYLQRKGSFPVTMALTHFGKRLAKNALLSVVGGSAAPWRRERLRGNTLALADVVRGRITPERIVDL